MAGAQAQAAALEQKAARLQRTVAESDAVLTAARAAAESTQPTAEQAAAAAAAAKQLVRAKQAWAPA